ncbi:hypothetical protein BWK59_08150 [Flavobacterium davisii]|uniref:Oxidase n=1 Tax=Flavobacterium davisii TaxID=2906077 RepID=A0A246GI12_9FLAO|nr:hypothetical protein [Flavobacterium davisii]OWP83878.1 hypothetical protein BWK59_08150 [Flavobacterium davisii]
MNKDFELDQDGDLSFINGDFSLAPSDQIHVEHILEAVKGEYKQHPTLGFGIVNYLKTNVSEVEFKRDLKIQLEHDNYKKCKINLTNGQLKIDI